jgi:hypothetical protein
VQKVSDIIALARLSIARSRVLITIAIAYFALIHLMVAAYGSSGLGPPDKLREAVTVFTGFLSLPLLAVAFTLFDFSDKADVSSNATGYLPWLLRSPLPNWKLVLVPLAMKTIWVLVVCGSIALTSRLFGMPLERWLLPTIGLATLPITACLITWHPFRWTYSRLSICGLLFVPAYGWLMTSAFFAFEFRSEVPDWKSNVSIAWAIGIASLAGTSLMAFRSVRLARYNVAGQITERGGWWGDRGTDLSGQVGPVDQVVIKGPRTISPVGALIRYDASTLSGVGSKIVACTWLAAVLYWSLLDVVDLASVVFMTLVLIYAAVFLCGLTLSNSDGDFLPNLLAMAPIRSTSIVWTRQVTATVIWFVSLLGVPIVMTVWHLRGAGEKFFGAWSETMSLNFGVDDAGWRMAGSITLIAMILIVRQTTWSIAAASTGRKRYALYVFVAKLAIGFSLFSWFLFHFMRFPNWEAWTEWAWQRTAEIPMLLPWLLIAKTAIVAFATWTLYRTQLPRPQTVFAIAVAYLVVTLLSAVSLWWLIPSEKVLLWHCIAVTAILMPYSRITLAPLCLARNRHR